MRHFWVKNPLRFFPASGLFPFTFLLLLYPLSLPPAGGILLFSNSWFCHNFWFKNSAKTWYSPYSHPGIACRAIYVKPLRGYFLFSKLKIQLWWGYFQSPFYKIVKLRTYQYSLLFPFYFFLFPWLCPLPFILCTLSLWILMIRFFLSPCALDLGLYEFGFQSFFNGWSWWFGLDPFFGNL